MVKITVVFVLSVRSGRIIMENSSSWVAPSLEEILTDFPSGPLDFYRKKTKFDWKKLAIFAHGEEVLKFQVGSCFVSHSTNSKSTFGQSSWQRRLICMCKLTFFDELHRKQLLAIGGQDDFPRVDFELVKILPILWHINVDWWKYLFCEWIKSLRRW